MKVTYQSKYIGIDTILIYLNKELKKYNKKCNKIEHFYENERDRHSVDMFEDNEYIDCCVRIKYIHKLIKKVKKGSI